MSYAYGGLSWEGVEDTSTTKPVDPGVLESNIAAVGVSNPKETMPENGAGHNSAGGPPFLSGNVLIGPVPGPEGSVLKGGV